MVQSVKRAMDILMVLSNAYGRAVPLEEIARATNLNKSTCVRLLGTLREDCFVQRVSAREGYRLGPFAYYLTRNSKYQQHLIEVCHPLLRWLNRTTGQTALLTVLYEDRKFVIHRIEAGRKLGSEKSDMILGNLMGTASGRILIAAMPRRERMEFFKKYGLPKADTWPGADNVEALERMLATYRRQGYAFVRTRHGDRADDLGYACEIHNNEKSVGAIGVAAVDTFDSDFAAMSAHRLILQKLTAAAREINRRIAFDFQDSRTGT